MYFIGAAEGTRTPDPIITNDVLYQLSYSGQLQAGYLSALTGSSGFSVDVQVAGMRQQPYLRGTE